MDDDGEDGAFSPDEVKTIILKVPCCTTACAFGAALMHHVAQVLAGFSARTPVQFPPHPHSHACNCNTAGVQQLPAQPTILSSKGPAVGLHNSGEYTQRVGCEQR